MEISRFFNHVDGDKVYKAEEFAEYFNQILSSGIFVGDDNLKVFASSSDRNIIIKSGKAWIMGYFYKNTDELVLQLNESHGTYDRIDRVVLRLDLATESRYIRAFIKEGTPEMNPSPPVLTRDSEVYEISLAQINVTHNTTIIPTDQVIDERFDSSVCGLVNSLIDRDLPDVYTKSDVDIKLSEKSDSTHTHTGSSSENFHNQSGCTQTGLNANAEGKNTNALGNYSHAEGYHSIAHSNYTHSEGCGTFSSVYNFAYRINSVSGNTVTLQEYPPHTFGLEGAYLIDANGDTGISKLISCSVIAVNGNILTLNVTPPTNSLLLAKGGTSGIFPSHAEGCVSCSIGIGCHAEGYRTIAIGNSSHAEGRNTSAVSYAHAEGSHTKAGGSPSHAEGQLTVANGMGSHAEGVNTTTHAHYSHIMGQYGDLTETGNAGSFAIAGGNSSNRKLVFRVTGTGITYGSGAFNTSGADYAEMFEWLDGNPKNEDRVGYFVTLDGDKIKIANETDDYILGVVSATPSVIGNNHDMEWKGSLLRDEWGRVCYEEVTLPETKETINGEELLLYPKRTEIQPVYSTDKDSEAVYIPREKRSEWSPVGMLGKILVRDDGSCMVNSYAKVTSGGIASAAKSGYRVLRRVNKNIIEVVVK